MLSLHSTGGSLKTAINIRAGLPCRPPIEAATSIIQPIRGLATAAVSFEFSATAYLSIFLLSS